MTNNGDLRIDGLCWSPKWIGPFESLWSLLRKFAFLNAASFKELRELLGRGKAWTSSQWKFAGRSDLRAFGGIDCSFLSRILKLDEQTLREGTVLPFLREGESEILASQFLRFCPLCMQANFHSSIYQIWLVRKCPIHNEQLTLRCGHCQKENISYAIESAPFAALSGCNKCFDTSNLAGQRQANYNHSLGGDMRQLNEVAALLLRRARMKAIHYPITAWIHDRGTSAWNTRRLSTFSGYWDDVVGPLDTASSTSIGNHACFKYRDPSLPQLKVTAARTTRPGPGGQPVPNDLNRELFSIYKSIRRHLERTCLESHRHCLTTVARLARSYPGVRLARGKICPHANMLIIWRMYWENLDQPYKLLPSYRRRNRAFAPELRIPITPPDFKFPRQFLARIFAQECFGVLDECRLLAINLHRKGFYSFNVAHLTWTRIPYWIIENPSDGVFRLHTWKQRPPSSLTQLFRASKASQNATVQRCYSSGLCLRREAKRA